MKFYLVLCSPLLVISMFSGCSRSERVAPSPTMEQDEVTIVQDQVPSESDQQTLIAAKEALQQRLSGRLMQAMSQGPSKAIQVCHEEAPRIAAEVGAEHHVKIGRVGVRLRNPNNKPPQWAMQLTDAKTASATFTTLSNDHAAALLPIKLQTQCLMCHGPTDQIAPIIKDQLARLYPDDQATGFVEGELRGWFWVETL